MARLLKGSRTISEGVSQTELDEFVGSTNIATLGTVTVGDISHTDIVYPSGHIIGSNRDTYDWVGDITVTGTSEVFGPVVSLQLKKANAKIYASYNVDGVLHNGENVYFNVAYKSSSFTAADGNDSHGASMLNQESENYFRSKTYNQYEAYFIQVTNSHALGNSAGDTYYFAAEANSTSAGWNPNNAGPYSHLLLNIWEIS